MNSMNSNTLPNFVSKGIVPGMFIRVIDYTPGKGHYKQVTRCSGKVISVHPNFAIIETVKGYKVTISRFDLDRVQIQEVPHEN